MRERWKYLGAIASLVTCHGCGSSDPPAPNGHWQAVESGLPAALLSVWGTSASDVYAVGSDPGDGPWVLHFDGHAWRRLATGAHGDLWWVASTSAHVLFMVGQHGLILRYDTGARSFQQMATPSTTPTLFGVWGASDSDVWAVGGDTEGGTGGVLWHFDGHAWSPAAGAPSPSYTYYKVWGRSAREIFAVGEEGEAVRYDGTSWTPLHTHSSDTIFTVHGNSSDVVAVGGLGPGQIQDLRSGSSFVDVSPSDLSPVRGVFVPETGTAYAVGNQGLALRRVDTAWLQDLGNPPGTGYDLHAVWVDPTGGAWAVGGFIATPPLHNGVVMHFGPTDVTGGAIAGR